MLGWNSWKKKLYAFEDRPIIREFFGRENSKFSWGVVIDCLFALRWHFAFLSRKEETYYGGRDRSAFYLCKTNEAVCSISRVMTSPLKWLITWFWVLFWQILDRFWHENLNSFAGNFALRIGVLTQKFKFFSQLIFFSILWIFMRKIWKCVYCLSMRFHLTTKIYSRKYHLNDISYVANGLSALTLAPKINKSRRFWEKNVLALWNVVFFAKKHQIVELLFASLFSLAIYDFFLSDRTGNWGPNLSRAFILFPRARNPPSQSDFRKSSSPQKSILIVVENYPKKSHSLFISSQSWFCLWNFFLGDSDFFDAF